jgi:uncharacterized protein YgfB (UPF0149 family)
LPQVSGIAVDYVDLAELLNRSGSPLPLAELHGGLCGVICASGREAGLRWLDELVDDCGGDANTLAELAGRLEALGNDTWDALSGLSMEFSPLLPDDDAAIEQRAEALGLWCHGFLAGLVIGGIDLTGGSAVLSEDLSELVHDFAAISQAGPDSQEFDDPDLGDNSLMELIEFVRVGAQFVFEELTAEQPAQRTIH